MSNRLSIAIIDDEPHAREKVRFLLEQRNEGHSIYEFASADEAYPVLLKVKPELLFLDVQMPGKSGIDLLEILKGYKPYVIFTSAFPQYAPEAFIYDAVHYLLKPFDGSLFYEAFERAQQRIVNERLLQTAQYPDKTAGPARNSIAVKQGGKHILLPTDDILYIESDHNNVIIHTASQTLTLRDTLSGMEERLSGTSIIRVHKGYVVNSKEVTSLESLFNGEYILTLKSGKKIPTGRTYKDIIEKWFLS